MGWAWSTACAAAEPQVGLGACPPALAVPGSRGLQRILVGRRAVLPTSYEQAFVSEIFIHSMQLEGWDEIQKGLSYCS